MKKTPMLSAQKTYCRGGHRVAACGEDANVDYCAALSIAWPPAEMSSPSPLTVLQPVRANKEISAVIK